MNRPRRYLGQDSDVSSRTLLLGGYPPLSIEKLISLRRSRVIRVRLFDALQSSWKMDNSVTKEATKLCEEFSCPVAEVFRAAIRRRREHPNA